MQPEGHGGPCAMGEQGSAPSGVYDYGTLEEDGPDTWETLIAPCGTRARVGEGKGRPEPRPMGMRESEGCIRAMTPGNGYPPGPGRAKAARVGVIVRRDP